ncbi:hypothetical protein X975_16696, partial [Stegodyphus mimosarum]
MKFSIVRKLQGSYVACLLNAVQAQSAYFMHLMMNLQKL